MNDHTEVRRIGEVLTRVARGERVAVVTDAGMPGISDPGERLVRAAREAEATIEVVPGPSAVVSALVVSGLPTGRFVFEGFLPRRGGARSERLRALAEERRTAVMYEAPHRLRTTIADLVTACGAERRVALVREITKLHEEVWRGRLDEAAAHLDEREPRGEYVVVLDGASAPPAIDDGRILRALADERASGRSTKDAVAAVAEMLDVSKRRVYELATRT
jgi:16S rRNA (cytidine1402-2'-O)-methyltransferase